MQRKKQSLSNLEGETEGARRATGVSPSRFDSPPTEAPDPEVVPKKSRRRLTVAYKLKILEEVDKCTQKGQIGAILRREGLYSSNLSKWKEQRRDGFFKTVERRGRPGLSVNEKDQQKQIKNLEKKVTSLETELEKASAIIDIQKKLCHLLGLIPKDNNGNPL